MSGWCSSVSAGVTLAAAPAAGFSFSVFLSSYAGPACQLQSNIFAAQLTGAASSALIADASTGSTCDCLFGLKPVSPTSRFRWIAKLGMRSTGLRAAQPGSQAFNSVCAVTATRSRVPADANKARGERVVFFVGDDHASSQRQVAIKP